MGAVWCSGVDIKGQHGVFLLPTLMSSLTSGPWFLPLFARTGFSLSLNLPYLLQGKTSAMEEVFSKTIKKIEPLLSK